MANWGNTDDAANSVLWAATYVSKTPNTVNQTALFDNTTPGAFTAGMTVGQFGVAANEVNNSNGSIVAFAVTVPGSGYFANTTVTISGNGTANAHANSLGRIDSVLITAAGSGYTGLPTVAIAAPTSQTFNSNTSLFLAKTFNANTQVNAAAQFISIAANPYSVLDTLTYTVAAGNTAVVPLANNTTYFVSFANNTGVAVSATSGGANISVIASLTSETGHTLTNHSGFIQIAGNVYQNNDVITYTTSAGNTAPTGLVSGAQYYVVAANSTGIKLSLVPGGTPLNLQPAITEAGHTLVGTTAVAVAVITAGASFYGAHAGWVLRKVGTGGRAGRVTVETLVAMGSIGTDAEDTIFKG